MLLSIRKALGALAVVLMALGPTAASAQASLETAFNSLTLQQRQHVQRNLHTFGMIYPQVIGYNGPIDGRWGAGTRAGVVDAVNRLNVYYDRGYNIHDAYHAIAIFNELLRGDTTVGEGGEEGVFVPTN